MAASMVYSEKGEALFKSSDNSDFESFSSAPDFQNYFKDFRLKEFRRFNPASMQSNEAYQAGDPWWQFSTYVDNFNSIKKREFFFSLNQILDKTMSALRNRKNQTGNLPNISFLLRKPEPLGTELKDSGCKVIGDLRFLELQRGKLPMREKEYCSNLGATAACTL